ncbi:MAG TPA: hydantoinase/oxoprolinase family protein [Nitriliruptorales bacterium]
MRLGVDVGGTFTDLVLEQDGQVRVAKVASTPRDQAAGVLDGIDRLGADPGDLRRFAHGTTVATNAVLERAGARTVLVTTEGFRDLLEIARQDRPSLYDLTVDRPPPLIPRDLVVEAPERVSAEGAILRALDEPGAVAAAVADLAPEAVAVCLLFSFLDDRHERAIVEALEGLGVPVSRSSAVLPVFREYERASTTALNAYVAPPMSSYLGSLERRLRGAGLTTPVEVMRSGGGTFTADLAARSPVHTLLSGPAAGAWGAAAVGRLVGDDELIAFDMGGTSTDVTLVTGGRPRTTSEGAIGGLPFAVDTTDIHTVGAGGGSIAWVDAGGALRVGPRSAGAEPGPAAYDRGGTEPTVTDANIVLGRLDPEVRLGGHMSIRPDLARNAVGVLAAGLGMGIEEAAAGIVRVVEATMVRALRLVSVERGHDPRGHTLVAFGGAGPLHQGALSRELGCRRVLVPPHAGVLSALGLLAAPVTTDELRTHLTLLADASADELASVWDELESRGRDTLAGQEVDEVTATRRAEVRYRGQAFELTVPGDDPDPAALTRAFHDTHRERYGYDQPDEPVEIVNLGVRVEGPAHEVALPPIGAAQGLHGAIVRTTRVRVDDGEREAPVIERERLGSGETFDGPAIVVGLDATCFVLPGQHVEVDDRGNLLITEG